MRCLLTLPFVIGLASAVQACPVDLPPDPRLAPLMQQVRTAPDEMAALKVTNELWSVWAKAPDAQAQDILDDGIERRAMFDLVSARTAFDELIAYCPDYAEGYNQRAFVSVLEGNMAAALPDLNRAVRLDPDHIPALTGRAMVLMRLERADEAAESLKSALNLNPWLPERIFLQELAGAAL